MLNMISAKVRSDDIAHVVNGRPTRANIAQKIILPAQQPSPSTGSAIASQFWNA